MEKKNQNDMFEMGDIYDSLFEIFENETKTNLQYSPFFSCVF